MAAAAHNIILKLYSYWKSSCSFRVRITLNLKEFLKLNPIGFVPVLVDGDVVIADSFAIVMKYIEEKVSPEEKLCWAKSAIEKGFTALEKLLKDHARRYATGDEVFLADLFLAPQLYAAFTTFNIDMLKEFPILAALHETYKEIPAIREALPESQPDAVT